MLSLASAALTLLTATALLLLAGLPGASLDRTWPPPAEGDGSDALPARDAIDTLVQMASAATAAKRLAATLGQLDGLGLADSRVVLTDTGLGDVPLTVERLELRPREGGGHVLKVRARLEAERPSRIDATVDVAPERIEGVVRIHAPAAIAALLALDDLDVEGGPLVVEFATGRGDDRPAAVDLVLRGGGPIGLRAAGMPEILPIDQLEAALTWNRDADAVDVHRAFLVSPALTASVRGTVATDRVRLQVALADVDASFAGAVWPVDVARGARGWLTQNIPNGRIERADLWIDLDGDALAGAPAASALRGTARVRDAEIHYLRPMPPVTEAAATARFDADRLVFEVTGGRLEEVEVLGGEIVISDYASAATTEQLTVDVRGRGPVPTMLAVVDNEPLTLASRYGLPTTEAAGGGTFRLQVALPLLADVALDDVDLVFGGDFEGVRLPGMAAGRDLTDAILRLDSTADRVEASGRGAIAGVPLEFAYLLDNVADIERLEARGQVPGDRLTSLGIPDLLPVAGPVGFEATLDVADGETRTQLGLDLVDAEVEVPRLALWKPAGIAGRIDADVVERSDSVTLAPVTAAWPGLDIRVEGELAPDGTIRELTVAPLRIAATDLEARAARRDAVLEVNVEGPRLDLSPMLVRVDSNGADADGPDALDLSWAIDEVVAGGQGQLRAATGSARLRGGVVETLDLQAGTPDFEKGLDLDIRPSAEGRNLTLATRDAGGVLRALDLSDALFGGTLTLDGTLRSDAPELRLAGELRAEDLVVRGVPPMVERLAETPEIADLADGDIQVARFVAPITVTSNVLTLEDAYLRAADLAVRFSGDIDLATSDLELAGNLAPLATLNQAIGGIPVLGPFLQGQRQAGAFALNFTVTGRREDPTVVVNPLSIITPGALADLFSGVPTEAPRLPDN